jgi:hypothetical protein
MCEIQEIELQLHPTLCWSTTSTEAGILNTWYYHEYVLITVPILPLKEEQYSNMNQVRDVGRNRQGYSSGCCSLIDS